MCTCNSPLLSTSLPLPPPPPFLFPLTQRWYLDGEVECFREGGHIALGLVAILLLSLLSLLPLVIFVFTLFARSPRIQVS